MKDTYTISECFKITEVGLLPEEWEVVKVMDVFELSRKPRNLFIDGDEEIPFIPMKLISEDTKSVNGYQIKKYSEISSGTFVLKNDLIVAKITPSFENGKQAIIDNMPIDYGYATTEIWALHPKENRAIVEHLYSYLKMKNVRAAMASKMEGTTGRQRLPRHVVENLMIPLPPIPEQKKIAAVLSTVQEAKEKAGAVIEAARELKKSLIKHLFTYGPVPVGEAENVRLKKTEIGLVPEEWEVMKLGDVAGLIMGQSPPGSTYNEKGRGMPFLQGKAEFGATSPKHVKYTTKPLKIAPKGSVLVSVRAPVGDVNIAGIDYCIGRGLASLSLSEGGNSFLFFLLNYFKNKLKKEGTGSTFKAINKSKLQEFKIPFPPLSVQQKIAEVLSASDKKIETEENKEKALEELFKTLLNNLMTARIRVNHLEIAA